MTTIEAIAQQASETLVKLITEAESEIESSIDAVKEEAALSESPARFNIGFAIRLNLDKQTMETALSFGVRRKLSVSQPIPDPN